MPTSSPTLIYGMSGVGKTSWHLKIARYKWLKEGRKTRWYLGDGGGQTLVGTEDFIEVMNYTLWPNPFDTTAKICEGYWPEDPKVPGSKLIKPPSNLGDLYGGFIFENITAMGDYTMGGLAAKYAEYRVKGGGGGNNPDEKDKDPTKWYKEGDTLVAANTMSHYGQGQTRILDNIQRTWGLPGYVGWTAWERTAGGEKDDRDRIMTLGPDVIGKALTKSIGGSFGHTIRLVTVPESTKAIDPITKKQVQHNTLQHRAYLKKHFDPGAISFYECYANVRFPAMVAEQHPELCPEYIISDPFAFYELMATLQAKEAELSAAISARSLVIV